jgi:hypothetical protein
MAWYRTGTVSVTNGSTAVTGSGTNFVAGAQVGEGFAAPDGRLYEIVTIVSATSLTIGKAYLGSTQTGQTYEIVPTQSLVADLAGQVSTLISDFQSVADEAGEGKFDYGTAASPGITFTLDQDTGFFHDTNNEIGVSAGGTKVAEFNSGGLSFPSGKGVAGDATITGDLNLGDELNLTATSNNFVDHYGTMRMRYYDGAAFYDTMSISSTATVFNDTGRDLDFRIESDTNSHAFFLQGSNGYVGISTASPLQPLHVNSSGNTQLLVSSSFNNSTNTGLTVDTVGDSSVARFNVTKSGVTQGTFKYLHAATAADQAWQFTASSSTVYEAGYAEHIWKTGNTERMRITSTGSVGIGTDSPAQKLDVNGTIKGTGFATASTTNPINYMDQNVVWTPTFLSSVGGETISYTVNSGQYCRYGEWVTCTGRIVVASVSGGSGSVFIGGLPFTTVNASVAQGTLQVGTAIGFVAIAPQLGGTLQNTVTCLLKYFDGSQATSFGWSQIQAGSTLFFTIIYRAA